MNPRIGLEGQGVEGLKKRREGLLHLAERFDLPPEALPTTTRLSVTAGRRLLLEQHRGILEYGEGRIVVSTREGRISISGSSLHLLAMNRGELVIGGNIQLVEWG